MTTYNTGNPVGSTDPRDLYDNAKNLDEAVNSDGDTFQDRLGKSRLTWAGIVKAGSGDPAIAVDAAARAEAAASQVQQDADQIAADAAQQAAADVVDGVDGQVAVAQSAADRAEAAAGSVKPYVDSALSDLSTAANKFYPTLAEANADIANIGVNQPIHVGEAVNGGLWYKATSGATTLTKSAYDPLTQAKADAAIKANAARAGAISQIATASTNLFNDSTSIKEGKVIDASGNIVTAPEQEFAYSDFIQIAPSSQYYYDGFRSVAYYDAEKNFISRSDIQSDGGSPHKYYGTLASPSNAYFVRLNYRAGVTTDPLDNLKMNKGATALPYEPFYLKIREEVEVAQNEGWLFDSVNIKDNSVTIKKVDFIKNSVNLFNDQTTTQGKTILGDGTISDNSEYYISDFIEVEPLTQYTISGGRVAFEGASFGSALVAIAYYDSDKNFISRGDSSNADGLPKTITIPANSRFVRFNINAGRPDQYNRMFNKGIVALPYEPYSAELSGVTLADDVLAKIKQDFFSGLSLTDTVIFNDSEKPQLLIVPDSHTQSDPLPLTGAFGPSHIKPSAIYDWYDDLLNDFPDYITKEDLGLDESGVYPIYGYKFSPSLPKVKPGLNTNTTPRVFITAIHAETLNYVYPFVMMREICRSWQDSELLSALRHGVEFYIMPCAQPYGMEVGSRTNVNGVDINRNFPAGWFLTPEGSTYSGTSPASEAETLAIMGVVESFKPHVAFDCHAYHGGEDSMIYVNINDETFRVASQTAALQTHQRLVKHFSTLSSVPFNDYIEFFQGRAVYGGHSGSYFESVGAVGGTIEATRNKLGGTYITNEEVVSGSSFILNCTYECLKAYKLYGSTKNRDN